MWPWPRGKYQTSPGSKSLVSARPCGSITVVRTRPSMTKAHSAAVACQCSSRIAPGSSRIETPAMPLEIGSWVTVASFPELLPITLPSDFSSANLKVGRSLSDSTGSGTLFMKLGSPAAAGCTPLSVASEAIPAAVKNSRRCGSDMVASKKMSRCRPGCVLIPHRVKRRPHRQRIGRLRHPGNLRGDAEQAVVVVVHPVEIEAHHRLRRKPVAGRELPQRLQRREQRRVAKTERERAGRHRAVVRSEVKVKVRNRRRRAGRIIVAVVGTLGQRRTAKAHRGQRDKRRGPERLREHCAGAPRQSRNT